MNCKVSVADATAFWQNLSGSYISLWYIQTFLSPTSWARCWSHVWFAWQWAIHEKIWKNDTCIPSHRTCCHTTSPHITICILNCCMIWFCALREDNDHIWPVLSPIAGNVLCWLGQTSTSGRQYALLGSVLGTPWSFFFNPLECFFLPERPLFTLFHGIDSHDSDKFLIEFEVAGRELDRFSKADIKDLMHGKVIRGLSGKGSWKYPERYAVSSLNCGTIVVELGITMSFVSRGFFHCLVCNVLLCDVRLQ